ncbi:unnamed protein product [Closterium sp. Yama58-4]|nr:unnamed protein product [Closterium sp. Yama58-4]
MGYRFRNEGILREAIREEGLKFERRLVFLGATLLDFLVMHHMVRAAFGAAHSRAATSPGAMSSHATSSHAARLSPHQLTDLRRTVHQSERFCQLAACRGLLQLVRKTQRAAKTAADAAELAHVAAGESGREEEGKEKEKDGDDEDGKEKEKEMDGEENAKEAEDSSRDGMVGSQRMLQQAVIERVEDVGRGEDVGGEEDEGRGDMGNGDDNDDGQKPYCKVTLCNHMSR